MRQDHIAAIEGRRGDIAGFVGVIANPESGRDIRRIVGHAIAVSNQQKLEILERLLSALAVGGVDRVEIMPDRFGLGAYAVDALWGHGSNQPPARLIDMRAENTAGDSLRAAAYLRQAGADCIIVLGGDGTHRVVSRACGDVPLLAISTGTNNVVPEFVEGTVAGLAAAYVALHPSLPRSETCWQHKRLVVSINSGEMDSALVDVGVISGQFLGAQPVWDHTLLKQVFVTRASPLSIGISSVIGMVQPVSPVSRFGAEARLQSDGTQVLAALVPGKLARVGVGQVHTMRAGVAHEVVRGAPVVLTLDGERELLLRPGDRAEVELCLDGPWLVDVQRVLLRAAREGQFAA